MSKKPQRRQDDVGGHLDERQENKRGRSQPGAAQENQSGDPPACHSSAGPSPPALDTAVSSAMMTFRSWACRAARVMSHSRSSVSHSMLRTFSRALLEDAAGLSEAAFEPMRILLMALHAMSFFLRSGSGLGINKLLMRRDEHPAETNIFRYWRAGRRTYRKAVCGPDCCDYCAVGSGSSKVRSLKCASYPVAGRRCRTLCRKVAAPGFNPGACTYHSAMRACRIARAPDLIRRSLSTSAVVLVIDCPLRLFSPPV